MKMRCPFCEDGEEWLCDDHGLIHLAAKFGIPWKFSEYCERRRDLGTNESDVEVPVSGDLRATKIAVETSSDNTDAALRRACEYVGRLTGCCPKTYWDEFDNECEEKCYEGKENKCWEAYFRRGCQNE